MAHGQADTETDVKVEISAGKLNGSAPSKAVDGGFWFKSRPCSTEGSCQMWLFRAYYGRVAEWHTRYAKNVVALEP